MSPMPKPSEATKERFKALLPDDPRVSSRPMFGQLAAFVNGNMFTGIIGDAIFVRPSDADYETLMDKLGGRTFQAVSGMPMKGYVVLPDDWVHAPKHDKDLRTWIARALESTAALPAKEAKSAKKSAANKSATKAGASKTSAAKKR